MIRIIASATLAVAAFAISTPAHALQCPSGYKAVSKVKWVNGKQVTTQICQNKSGQTIGGACQSGMCGNTIVKPNGQMVIQPIAKGLPGGQTH